MVICLQRGANDLHMVQLMLLPPHHFFVPVKSRMVCLSGAGLPRLSWKKGHSMDVVLYPMNCKTMIHQAVNSQIHLRIHVSQVDY